MVEWKGTDTVFGMVEAATWATAVAAGAGHQIPFISADPAIDAQLIRTDALTGTPFRGPGLKGNELHSGPFVFPLDFETVHRLLAFSFGSIVAPVQQHPDVAYLHEAVVAGSDKGQFVTGVLGHAGIFVKEYTTMKLGDLTISVQSGDNVPTIQVQMTPHRLITDDSGANTLATLGNINERVAPVFVQFEHLSILINDESGAALTDSNDRFEISGFTLTLTKNARINSVTTRNAPYVDEPIRNGFFDVSGSFQVAELEDATRINEVLNKTKKKAHILLDGPVANGATNFQLRFELASLQLDEAQNTNPTAPGLVTPNYTFLAARASANPTGFTHSDAVRAFITNTDDTAPLT